MSTRSLSGLSEGEAQEFATFYYQGMAIFVIIASIAHILIWLWRPWFPGPEGYVSLEGVTSTTAALLPMLT